MRCLTRGNKDIATDLAAESSLIQVSRGDVGGIVGNVTLVPGVIL